MSRARSDDFADYYRKGYPPNSLEWVTHFLFVLLTIILLAEMGVRWLRPQ